LKPYLPQAACKTIVLGAGVTGIAAGKTSNSVVYEASEVPGGLCSSYYLEPSSGRRVPGTASGGAYRFEVGGGHWIFGGNPAVRELMQSAAPLKTYQRRSAVFFSKQQRYVPYPLQNNLHCLEPAISHRAASEMEELARCGAEPPARTMKQWLAKRFGPTLCDLFFNPFHERYTAGLYDRIAAQDDYKSPQRTNGYNPTFVYPIGGLDALARRLVESCRVEYEKRAVGIDVRHREVAFADGSGARYEALVSTLPLNRTLELANLDVCADSDPHTSVLVLNIGATRGRAFPDQHWLYVADADAGFHRIGFYSNVDRSFVPETNGTRAPREGMYVERAYERGSKPDAQQIARYADAVVTELQQWGFIDELEVLDASWIDVAYTWSWPGSLWRSEALRALDECDIHAVGRYGRWIFQGIADSIRDGLSAGVRMQSA
jgi:protoporphyrinogen oxidase